MKNETVPRMRRKISLMIVVASLIVNAVLTGLNVYLTFQFRHELANLGFQDKVFNVTSVVVGKATDANLGEPSTYFLSDNLVHKTVHYGTLYTSVQVLNSHYGALTIALHSFDPESSEYLNPDKLNDTKLSFANENQSNTYVLAPGFNQLNPELPLRTEVYPNPEKLPSQGESVQFSLGTVSVEAEFVDFDTLEKTSIVFSANVLITLEIPN